MGLHLKQNETRSQLQTKIGAELQQRMKDREKIELAKPEPAILDNQRSTSGWGVIITILVFIIVALLIYLLRP